MIFKILNHINPLNLFRKKKIEEAYPPEFLSVGLTDIAKMKGVDDDFNKVIKHYRGGEVYKKYKYTEEMLQSLIKVHQIPFVFEEDEAEEFDFKDMEDMGVIKEIRRK